MALLGKEKDGVIGERERVIRERDVFIAELSRSVERLTEGKLW